jgi:putative heme iron utilization protein
LLLLSRLAEHTKNLEGDARASILVAEPDATDPLAAGRMTIVGTCARAGESADARAMFLATHPEATQYAGLPDFAMWRLEVVAIRWIGGFGRMQWVSADHYANG